VDCDGIEVFVPLPEIVMSETAGCGLGPKSGKGCKGPTSHHFSKKDRSAPVNYRPVSLTSVCSKVMEHIIHSQIIKHMDKLGLLADSQHGFQDVGWGPSVVRAVRDPLM
jgi:hypothetical protein